MSRRDRFTRIDGFEIHCSEWGDASDPPVLCVHGLSRVGRDFDPLARALEDDYHVVCPDMPGRGLSQWADDPDEWYGDSGMTDVIVGLVDELDADPLRYVGTSMGGSLGIGLAAGPLSDRISHLVVNDISPNPGEDADEAAIGHIMDYVPDPPTFDRFTELEDYFHELYEGRFSPMTDGEWRRLALTSTRRTGDGGFAPAYDPRIVTGGDDEEDDGPDPWDAYASIDAEIMILRGTDSGILPREPFERMQAVQPDAVTVEVDCEHAPSLNTDDQIEPIRSFFA